MIEIDNRAFERQSEGPELDTQRNGNVPFLFEKCFKNIYIYLFYVYLYIYIESYRVSRT